MPPFDPNAAVKQVESQTLNTQPDAGNAAVSGLATAEKKEPTLDDSKTNLLTDEFPTPRD